MRLLFVLAFAVGCAKPEQGPTTEPYPDIVPGAPVAGAAEGVLELPMGTPLSGFTSRCTCLGGSSRQDDRDSAYNVGFVESIGVQTYPSVKAIWLENGDDHLVWVKTDSIYSADNLVTALTEALEQQTGLDLDGKVVHSTNHSHGSFGDFFQGHTFYLGSDRYNEEIGQRFVGIMADVAMEAYETRQPAKIGLGWAKNWDPDDRVYRDRRPENDDLKVWPDMPPGGDGKDPHLAVLRIDDLNDNPIAMTMTFGMHGTSMGGDSPMVSGDSGLHVEMVVQEAFDSEVVVMFNQGAGGDASPGGTDGHYAKMETLGEYAVDAVMDLWEATPTSKDPIRLETTSRHVRQHSGDIHVTRDGTTDLYYTPYDELYTPDQQVYDENGDIISPIDEFNTEWGAVFCGSGELDLPVGGIDRVTTPEYTYCVTVTTVSALLTAFFRLDETLVMPLPETMRAGLTSSRMGPLATLTPEGKKVTRDLMVGWFPGETTSMFAEQFRRRVEAELGYEQPLMVGYSQDHEGYLLIPEDWLVGGYEPDISIWGPLQGEYLMEQLIYMSDEVLGTDVHDDPDPYHRYEKPVYWDEPLPTLQPDETPDAGTRLDTPHDCDPEDATCNNYVPDGQDWDLTIPAQVPRVTGVVQLAWKGGDPGVDSPRVVIERQKGNGWEEVTSHSGRTITAAMPDILLTHNPDPLYPQTAKQDHIWWASWQTVAHVHDRQGLPLGTYRLKATGHRYTGGNETWPWNTKSYSVTSESFELVPATLTISADTGGYVASVVGPSDGYRLIAMGGAYNGHNPVQGPLTVDDGVQTPVEVEPTAVGDGRVRFDFVADGSSTLVTITDAYGNVGTIVP